MKKVMILFVIATAINLNHVNAQDTWVQKADFGGVARTLAFGFLIGSKGYFGAGCGSFFMPSYYDFWEYDPSTNSWTQKADYYGSVTETASFSIGNKGYVGTGFVPWSKHLWEYDPASNHSYQLNIKDFPAGTYFVKIIPDFGIETQKLMVE